MYRSVSGASAILESVWCMPEKTSIDIDERMSIIGSDGFVHIQDTFPNFDICNAEGFRSPCTAYSPEMNGVLGGAPRWWLKNWPPRARW